MEWYLYIIICNDTTLYTGITTDVHRRFKDHHGKKGAKYLRGRKPLRLGYYKKIGSKSLALKVERKVKKLSKGQKENLIMGFLDIEMEDEVMKNESRYWTCKRNTKRKIEN